MTTVLYPGSFDPVHNGHLEIIEVAARNLQTFDSVALFELNFVYLPKPGQQLPDEPRRLAVVLCGRRSAAAWDDPLGEKPAAYE